MLQLRSVFALLLIASLGVIACADDDDDFDSSDPPTGGKGGRDAGSQSGRDAGRDSGAPDPDADPDDPCVVALHVDDCCGSYEPVRLSAVQEDECLQAVPASSVFGSDLVKRCMMKTDASCDPGRCNQRPLPPSRSAIADGAGCRYADECNKDSECVAARSIGGCCNCPEPTPAKLLDVNRCVVHEDEPSSEWPLGCAGCNLPVDCGECEPSDPARCGTRGSLRVCVAAESRE